MKKQKTYYQMILEIDYNGDFKSYIRDKINQEGFHYTFAYYSNFPEVKDKHFHKLRKEYVRAAKTLSKYLGYSV
jgi:hypothetical protein